MDLYLAVIADVIKSRNVSGMNEIPNRIQEINGALSEEIFIPFKCMRGDEIEAVLVIEKNFMKAIRTLKYYLQPMKIRIGLGIGQLDIDNYNLPPSDPFLLSGTAFYAARDAVDFIGHVKKQESIILNCEPKLDDHYTDTWNLMFGYYCNILNGWNKEKWDAVMSYEKHGSMMEAANELGKRYQSIQRSIERADWDIIKDTELWMSKEITTMINQIKQT